MKNPYATPKFISKDQQRLGKTNEDKRMFASNLFAWDVFKKDDDGTLTGYDNADDFVSAVVSSGQGSGGDVIFNIALRPSTTLPSSILRARRDTGTENYQQQEDDFAKLFYSKEIYEFIIKEELDFNNKLIFFTLKSIYNVNISDYALQIKDTDFYIIDSYKTITKADGKFDYGILRIKKLNPITKRGSSIGENGVIVNIYTRFHFFRINIQPKKVKRIRRTFSGIAVLFAYQIFGENISVPVKYKITDNSTNWFENLFPFRITGQAVSVWPLWSQEWAYWYDVIGAGDINNRLTNFNKIEGNIITHGKDERITDNTGGLEITGNQGEGFSRVAPIKKTQQTANETKYWYSYTHLSDVLDLGNFPIDDLIESSSETIDFLLSNGYDLFGLTRRSSASDATPNAIPRKQGTNGFWTNLKEELLYFFDFMTDEALIGLGIEKAWGTYYPTNLEMNENKNLYTSGTDGDYTPYFYPENKFGSNKRKENLANLLQRNLNWMNNSWTTLPEGNVVENTIDVNVKPWEYDGEKLNSHIGLFPFNIKDTWNMSSGINFTRQIGTSSVVEYRYLLFGKARFNYTYLLGNQYQLPYLPYEIFYQPDNKQREYVIEIEFDETQETITKEDIYQLGGNTSKIEYFENSYEEAKTEGDSYCKISIDLNNDGNSIIDVDLPPQTYPAPNNQGNPRLVFQEIVYGVVGSND